MSRTDIAWMTGLFEGEGYITSTQVGLGINMTDLDILQRFQSIVGVGSIRPRKVYGETHKPCWSWAIWNKADVYRLLELMLPYFGERRALAALNRLDSIDGC